MSKDHKNRNYQNTSKLNDKLWSNIPRTLVPCKWAELIHTGGGMVTKWWLKYTNVSMPAQWKKRYSLYFVLPFTNLRRKQNKKYNYIYTTVSTVNILKTPQSPVVFGLSQVLLEMVVLKFSLLLFFPHPFPFHSII
jgi:hypothetical protein